MLSSTTMATYNQISQMRSVINSFISQAMIANSNITANLSRAITSPTPPQAASSGIGSKINLFA